MTDRQSRLTELAISRMLDSLDGLSVGDAFGEQFFIEQLEAERLIAARSVTVGPWSWTDDTTMALVIVAVLERKGTIDQDTLAASFGVTYRADPRRGYGPGMHGLLARYMDGSEWRELAPAMFGGQGSFGNGAAMRVAPLGAFFAGDIALATDEAVRSAEVTHCHPEAIAGAIGVAVAAALAAGGELVGRPFLDAVYECLTDSEVRRRLDQARRLTEDSPQVVARLFGNGSDISAQDTVPFCLWVASRHLDNYYEALWETVAALGDRDTTCAIVGGIVAARVGRTGIPANWRSEREVLPPWVRDIDSSRT